MDGISDNYQSQVKHYRNTHFGDDPTLIRNIKFGLRSVFSSVKRTDPSQDSTTARKSLLKTKQRIISLNRRKIDHPPTLLTKHHSPLSHTESAPHLISAEEFKEAALNNDYSRYSGSVFIDGDLDLSNLLDIKELPKRLYVDGDLILSGCTKLRSLPKDKLRVTGSLVAENCRNVRKVTQDIKIGEDINFRNCIHLRNVPRRIRDIGYRSDLKQRHINFEKTNVFPSFLFLFSDTKKRIYHFSSSLVRVITKWADRAAMDLDFPRLDLTDREERQCLCDWLRKLNNSADFIQGSRNYRKHFARRVMKVISDALNDPEYKEVVMRAIEIAGSSCYDGAALGLDDIEKLFLLKRAEAIIDAPDAEQKLRNLARQIMHLEMLENYVHLYLIDRTSKDQIEVMLHFKTRLRRTLNLPINVQDMNYPLCAFVPRKRITEAKEFVLSQSTPEALDNFLSNWAPWKMLKAKQSVPDYEALETCAPPAEQECPILRDTTDKMVVLNNQAYDYENLKKWYVTDGTDPCTRKKFLWSEVKRFSRSQDQKSDDSSNALP